MPKWVLRIILVVVSIALGYATTYLIVVAPFLLDTTVAEYAWGPEQIPLPYFFLTGLFLSFTFALILDRFMGTEILPD